MPDRHVYLVCQGEWSAGNAPLGVRSTYAGAVNLAGVSLPGARIERVKDGRWKAVARNGVDEIWIYRMAVDDAA